MTHPANLSQPGGGSLRNFGVVGVLVALGAVSWPLCASAQPTNSAAGLVGRLNLAASDTDLPPTTFQPPPPPPVAPKPAPESAPDNWNPKTKLFLSYEVFDQKFGESTSDLGIPFTAGSFSGSGYGVQGQFDWWGLGIWKSSGKLKDPGGVSDNYDLMTVAVNVGSVGSALLAAGGPTARIGIYYPELSIRYTWGSQGDLKLETINFSLSVATVRATFGDKVFAELRAGSISYETLIFTYTESTTGTRDSTAPNGFNFAFNPSARVGLIF